ncbi:MAG: CDP-alcohol phosphatidyltransferase family protein [Verrucomicrobia bacterium]|nr:CDP-alcohol phosphatidyltransferase family protein [Verrucomicrobiota bacterium]
MSMANYITFIRVFLSPVFLVVYLEYPALGLSLKFVPYVLLFLLLVNELSDLFDGYVARRTGQVTDLGKILDPMADSISRISIFLTFTQGVVQLPLLLVFIFLYRDSVVGTLRTVCGLRGFALAARTSGKVKAIVQGTVAFIITFLLLPYSWGMISQPTLRYVAIWLVAIAGIYTVFSAADYIYANRSHIKKLLTIKE